ncbi:hypothetical protein Sru01_33720 [Sphaerisporangium rufum]|uniref:Glycosyltransferase family 1 protein n=1 Tax=Sphaerisporangium rufum TaxID=1381558 RepID=A0A919V5K5_9ACTN|nr:hypothetical protein Sru01_33720 [Sphaerisporangium rufum]
MVAVHDWMACPAGLLCRLLGRRPVVFHVHSTEMSAVPGRPRGAVSRLLAAVEDAMARRATAIVAPSVTMRDQLVARGWPAGRLHVVPHGCEVAELAALAELPPAARHEMRTAVRSRHLPGGTGALVVFAGRLSAHKGVDTLVRAVPLLRTAGPVVAVLAGTGAPRTDDNARVAELIAGLGVADQVRADYRFLDPDELFGLFLAADVCVFPSTYEPFGLVAIEAMALGRPVVVGPGYSPEVVATGAVRCARDDPATLAAAIDECLGDRAAAEERGRRAAESVRENYTWARTVALTLAVYREAGDRAQPAWSPGGR